MRARAHRNAAARGRDAFTKRPATPVAVVAAVPQGPVQEPAQELAVLGEPVPAPAESAPEASVPPAVRPLRVALRSRPATVSADVRLLAIASDHLARLGPKRVTVVAVAAEAGMTHANVYRYFPSKDALLDAVVGRWLRDVEAELARIADAPDPADDKIERLLTALAAAQRETLSQAPHLFAVHLDAAVAARPIARRHRVRLRNLVERVVEEGIGAGAFVARDRERAIAYIFDASYRFTHPLAIQNDADLPRDLVDLRFGVVIQAIQRSLRSGQL
nr:TetR family transcriptional regulator [Methylobacterium sp. Leaf108]